MMRLRLFLVASFAVMTACGWMSCESPMEKERRELQEAGESTEALVYRGLKVTMRSAPIDPDAGPQDASATKIGQLLHRIAGTRRDAETPLSASEYVELAREFYALRDQLRTVDEDDYPTLLAQIGAASKSEQLMPAWYNSDWEHLVLATAWIASQKAPPAFVVYELGELDPAGIHEPGVRVLARLLRSLAFTLYGWSWLTDEEATAYLDDLERNRAEIIAFTRGFDSVSSDATDEQVYAQWHAPGVLLRGLARHRKGDEDPALEDLDAFVTDAETIGLEDEGVWLIGAYVGIRREDTERALTNLRKLEASPRLGDDEKKLVRQAIEAIEDRDPDAAFNVVTDKWLVAQIVGGYVLRVLAKVEWRKELEQTDSGRALLGADDEIEAEVDRIGGALSPEQVDELEKKAGEAARRFGAGARDEATKAWHRLGDG